MSPLYDHAGLAALVPTLTAAEESEAPPKMTGSLSKYIDGLVERNGPATAREQTIALARQHFIALDPLATQLNLPAGKLPDAIELELLESPDDGS